MVGRLVSFWDGKILYIFSFELLVSKEGLVLIVVGAGSASQPPPKIVGLFWKECSSPTCTIREKEINLPKFLGRSGCFPFSHNHESAKPPN